MRHAFLALILFTPFAFAVETPPPPEEFTEFVLPGHEAQAEALNNYLWYHFHHRLGNDAVLFNKEYLTTADLWLHGAVDKHRNIPIQEVHRDILLSIQPDAEGYVPTNQHFSHSHDYGWPFPLWTQSGRGHAKVMGKTIGWHFQPVDAVQGWVKGFLKGWNDESLFGEGAAAAWSLEDAESQGIVDNVWRIAATGDRPALISPADKQFEAFQAPFVQFRWKNAPEISENWAFYWKRDNDTEFAAERRVEFAAGKTPLSGDRFHVILPMHEHPLWTGVITQVRLEHLGGPAGSIFDIDSFFTVYDTRHTINNPIYILSSAAYFNWTGDVDFLRATIDRMRVALRYQDTVMGGREHGHIRNTWPGHDGLAGWKKDAEGNVTVLGGHGIGSNYWDLMPFGWDDFYATYQYHASLLALAELEEAIAAHPEWEITPAETPIDAAGLRTQATRVKEVSNEKFWSEETGRFIASIDQEGTAHDYGYTFVNLDAIWYGIASDSHAESILDWLEGRRLVAGDTSQGADIYHWRFGPRASTLRNVEWYGQGWHGPESIPWGGQVQDGGAVLGFTFYDLWARLQVVGPDNAWARLMEILAWETEVQAAGGYRAYYADGSKGTTLQGGGSAGGLGIDFEFFESSLLPSIMTYGFLGLDPRPGALHIAPKLPAACPEMRVENLRYQGEVLDIRCTPEAIVVSLDAAPSRPLQIQPAKGWVLSGSEAEGPFTLNEPGDHTFKRRTARR